MFSLLKWSIFIGLAFPLTLCPVWGAGSSLRRQKREWILAPRPLYENVDYTTYDFIAKIHSDKQNFTKILYYLTGPGADQPPVGRFSVDLETGFIQVHEILDREDIAFYNLKGVAKYAVNGSRAEKDIDLKIKVLDKNDCLPVIKSQQVGYVNESSAANTFVMKVIATDDDEENTAHSSIYYKIEEQSNAQRMFYINSQTGVVRVQRNTLDRETKDTYKLRIIATDMDGEGISSTGEIEIKLLDINDNIPVLEKESYEVSVMENTVGLVNVKIKAIDKDLIHTDNWLAVYEIVSGNEAGHFNVTTNTETNEAIIMVQKALDYEELKSINLGLRVSNKAEYQMGSMTGASLSKTYLVKVNVENEKEGPRFQPSTKVVTVSEESGSFSTSKVITTYAAIDSDTLQTATNVRYQKLYDADNWLTIDEKTAEIRLNKLPDRESTVLINGTYYAKILCVTTDGTSKTATGTIAIQVEDFNDHCPKLTATTETMCFESNVIFVTAVDEDYFPNSAPFDFTVIQEDSRQKWTVEHFNGTTVILRDQARLWPGKYKVMMEIHDQQGKSCGDVQVLDLMVCTCSKGTKGCVSRSSSGAVFGASGVLLLLLGLLLLLLVPLLLMFCLCGAAARDFKKIPFEAKQHLIAYHTEGQGEDKDIPAIQVPVEIDIGTMNTQNVGYGGNSCLGGLIDTDGAAALGGTINGQYNSQYKYSKYGKYTGQMDVDFLGNGMMEDQDLSFSSNRYGFFDGMALSDHYLEEYYVNKSQAASQQAQEVDHHLIYNYEGQESPAGSVGCCSLLENDNDLAFLDDLGPKFKTLAEICQGSTLVSESVSAGVSVAPIRPVSPARPSTSSHTHVHTHTETIRDRDSVNINNLSSSSNVASGSATIIKEERFTEHAHSSATVPKVHVQDNVVIPNQTLLIQQPAMYYAATPMYMVESKPQMVLVSGGAQQVGQVGQVGLSQGLMQVGGLQGSQGVVLVDGQVGMVGATGQVAHGLSQGSLSSSTHVLMVEKGSLGGDQGTHLAQGFVQAGQGPTEAGFTLRGTGAQVKTFSQASVGSAASHEDLETAAPKMQGSQRVIMQHKKVSVTEKKI